jgi:DegV family protein with EDD domain
MAKRRCNIISDSCCDLPRELYESLDIGLMKFPYIMDDGEHFDDLFAEFTPHQFYERLRKGEIAQTSQIPYMHILEVFEQCAQEALPTVFLCFTSGLSGNLEAMQQACQETLAKYPRAELYVVDTLLASAAEGFLVWEAVRQADRGLTAKELVAWVEEARYFVNAFFTLPDLESLKRGGRVPDIAALAGAKLDIKPIITIDLAGRLSLHGAARGRKKSIKQLLQLYVDRHQPGESNIIILASSDAPKELKQMKEHLEKMTVDNPPVILNCSIGPVIGAHVGPDMLAICFWGVDRREHMSLTDRIAHAVSGRSTASKIEL